jgi:hypothetical protein
MTTNKHQNNKRNLWTIQLKIDISMIKLTSQCLLYVSILSLLVIFEECFFFFLGLFHRTIHDYQPWWVGTQ